ncbi:unnamed protein product [Moneuplotes crassus]|uniref:Anaphase-promoting complex subunit 6 n=1 Tax=Euplotes crassus TaxID=5936 RepID=A0AAD1X5M8_EUPCR|nr:unnamed protein product [Moneuplotes crassus]
MNKDPPANASPNPFEMVNSYSQNYSHCNFVKKLTDHQLLDKLKNSVNQAITHKNYVNAIFYADKLISLSIDGSDCYKEAIYDLANICYLDRQYSRCIQLIEKHGCSLNKKHPYSVFTEKCQILAAQAMLDSNKIEDCIEVLQIGIKEMNKDPNEDYPDGQKYYQSFRHLLLGKALETQEKNFHVIESYKKALEWNPENFEAFDRLFGNYLLTQEEKKYFLADVNFTEDNLWLSDYYILRIYGEVGQVLEGKVALSQDEPCIKISNTEHFSDEPNEENPKNQHLTFIVPASSQDHENISDREWKDLSNLKSQEENHPPILEILKQNNNSYMMLLEAEKLYHKRNPSEAYEILKAIFDEDLYFFSAIPLYIAIMTELRKVSELYMLAHNLVCSSSGSAISWYAVGAYYYLIKKYDVSRQYFKKSSKIDQYFAPSWIALGHSYALNEEADLAMSVYRTTARLFPGCHQANQCIGMEYFRLGNSPIALISFNQALKIYDNDAFLHNEKGIVLFREKKYDQAEQSFFTAYTLAEDKNSKNFEAILMNFGHCQRKLKRYDEAIMYYEKCLHIDQENADTFGAIGFTYHLKQDFRTAMNYYNKANFLNYNDQFIQKMIECVLEDLSQVPIEDFIQEAGV